MTNCRFDTSGIFDDIDVDGDISDIVMQSRPGPWLPANIRTRWRRQSTVCRVFALVVLITFGFLAFTHTTASVPESGIQQQEAHEPTVRLQVPPGYERPSGSEVNKRRQSHAHNVDVIESIPEQETSELKQPKTERKTPTTVPKKAVSRITSNTDDDDDDDFDVVFRKAIDLIPSSRVAKSLLTPFLEHGERHLQDLGSRVRAFKPVYEAWEKLHLIESHGLITFRTVVQSIRKSSRLSKDTKSAIQNYDQFRTFVNEFAARLFPGPSKVFGSLMSLHASFYGGGRGIVITVGDEHVHYVLTSIQALRKLGCNLPFEVMYLGDEDLGDEEREQLEQLPGVVTRDMSSMIDDKGWEVKGESWRFSLVTTSS
jgi:hypothetical protein